MKILEQEWQVCSLDSLVVENVEEEVVADVRVPPHDGGSDAARLMASAPKMARALLEIRSALSNNTLDPDSAHEVCERVLHDAGVL